MREWYWLGKGHCIPLGLCDGEKENKFAALVQRVWQHPNVHEGKDLQTIFNRLGVSPDFVYHSEAGNSSVHAIHYQQEGAEIYFVANRKRAHEKGTAHFG